MLIHIGDLIVATATSPTRGCLGAGVRAVGASVVGRDIVSGVRHIVVVAMGFRRLQYLSFGLLNDGAGRARCVYSLLMPFSISVS